MTAKQPLGALQVVAVRHIGARPMGRGDALALGALLQPDVLGAGGVPWQVSEPAPTDDWRTGDAERDLGTLCGAIAEQVAAARRAGKAVALVGGNCNHAVGVVGGLQQAHGAGARLGLVWFDAHGDFNTPRTTLTGSLGGMPVAVIAGLALPRWREGAGMLAPLPSDRIIEVDLRNLDAPEEALLRATDVVIAAPAPGYPGRDLAEAVAELAAKVDMLYLHVDSDVVDASLTPNHHTKEPNGIGMEDFRQAIELVMATGIVVAYAVVSVFGEGEGHDVMIATGAQMVRDGLAAWARHGTAHIPSQPA
jgi:arginase